ncbi:hypothetical protein [Paracoccus versutus]|uniref:hypothetical protein n=1 Tax=Paracoccus versutus TaxID=34007 RepID=UPI0011C03409|nr:hypothetical protein [Paracoccus versutus]WGR56629.1 hypothetical protein E3U25_11085 [Paracoccus versutus]WGR61474.1 hypothetical protein E3U26_12575 [Paracoccus ferrooxidans]
MAVSHSVAAGRQSKTTLRASEIGPETLAHKPDVRQEQGAGHINIFEIQLLERHPFGWLQYRISAEDIDFRCGAILAATEEG